LEYKRIVCSYAGHASSKGVSNKTSTIQYMQLTWICIKFEFAYGVYPGERFE